MKKFYSVLLIILIGSFDAFSQSEGINYQAVARGTDGIELANQTMSIQITILSGSTLGTMVWQEEHVVVTNEFGLFTIQIGMGTSTSSGTAISFDVINWGIAKHFLKVEIDENGGTSYVDFGTTELMSVPYALYAKRAGAVAGGGLGNTILNGDDIPLSSLGSDGDFYIDTQSQSIYGPKTSGNWGGGNVFSRTRWTRRDG